PNNALFHNDLGAAILEKAREERDKSQSGLDKRDSSSQSFNQCLGSFRRALETDPKFAEPLFNRALCHQLMGLPRQAHEDWTEYLQRDSTSEWSGEARQYLHQLDADISKRSLNRDSLLEEYLRAFRKADNARAWQIISENRDVNGSGVENELLADLIRDKA